MGDEVVEDAVGGRVGRWVGASDGEVVGDEVGEYVGSTLVAIADEKAHAATMTVINGTICLRDVICASHE
jgi:hypothetical protein